MPAPEPMPGYGQLLKRGYGSLTEAIKACGDCGWELSRRTWTENAYLGWGEVLLCGLCALGWTVLRRAAARRLFGVSPYRRGGTGTGGGGHAHVPPGDARGTGGLLSSIPGTGWMGKARSPFPRGRILQERASRCTGRALSPFPSPLSCIPGGFGGLFLPWGEKRTTFLRVIRGLREKCPSPLSLPGAAVERMAWG